jgi:hypothetical protein
MGWDTGGKDGYEMVVFDTDAIKKARLVWVPPTATSWTSSRKREPVRYREVPDE